MKTALKIIVSIIGGGLLTAFLAVVITFNIKRLHVIRRAREATEAELESIYSVLDGAESAVRPICAILARTNKRAGGASPLIPIPEYVQPWGGRTLTVENRGKVDIRFSFTDARVNEPELAGKIWRIVPALRVETKSGKARNQFLPAKYLAKNPKLHEALGRVCPKYPAELLSYLLAAGAETFEFDGINQARIGDSPAWVQDAEFPNCPECSKRMSLIFQLPGSLLPGKSLPEGTFFFFGCPTHQSKTATVAQFG